MARRAASAVAAVLAFAVLALPTLILTSHQPAAAATGQRTATTPPFSIFITSITPQQWVTPRGTITITGTLRNNSKNPASQLTVQLSDSPTPVLDMSQLLGDVQQPYSAATTSLSVRQWRARRPLAPGDATDWSIRVPASALNATIFGVYPVAAQAYQGGSQVAVTTTYLPYEPDRKGPYASSRPAPAKIAWLWPLIDVPLLNAPWQGSCSGPQASALAQSVGQGGRLGELVRAGGADQDVTWIVDPAVLANVQALENCQSSKPMWAKAASAWLTSVKVATKGRPLTVTPYGDPNAAALIAVNRASDVQRSFSLGQALAGGILNHRDLNPATLTGPTASTDPLAQAAGIAWSAQGIPDYSQLEQLGPADHVHILVLSTSAFPGGQYSVLKTPDGGGTFMTALLASQSLTELVDSRSSAPGSAFTTEQLFLAETALLARRLPAQAIVVAPPRRWAPQAGLAAGLLNDTNSAPWLSQTTLTALAAAPHIPIVPAPQGNLGPTRVTRPELRKIRIISREILQLESIRAGSSPGLWLALSALESSALQNPSDGSADAILAAVTKRVAAEQQGVRIIAEKRITLGGLKGSVPVSIDNRLGYAIKVQLQLQYDQASGVKIVADPQGPITVPARQTQTIRLRVQATAVGSTTVTMLLATPGGDSLTVPLRMTIQATQVGVLGMIIFAIALGVFLIASAVRAVRRGRPGVGADGPAGAAPAGDHDRVGRADPAEADTVNAERGELGAVGKPGP